MLNNTSTDVIAVDTSSKWVSAVKKDNESNGDRLHIYHSNLGDVGGFGRPLSYEKIDSLFDYTDFLWKHKKTPKLALVDCRLRVCCFLISLKFAEEETKTLFDVYTNRLYYHFVEKYVSRLEECGRQCMFVLPSKAEIDMVRLDKDIVPSKNVMD